ncbi:MAG: KpsF/GutQ family sugar-phosphate isomerase [Candidatus Omnitrophica bacterium]|nr:KpsF/GutQ family sugar-phosphate isomerase [Candidatus Omnitrophota bacterium]
MMKKDNIIKRAKEVLRIECDAVESLLRRLDEKFEKAVDIVANCRGHVVVTGLGKAGIIGQKFSATLSSLGVPSFFLHPVEALHGDLGKVQKDDVVIAFSNSGQTEEVSQLLPSLKKLGVNLIAFTGNAGSILGKESAVVLNAGVEAEACTFGLAPTASTTAMLVLSDALAIVASEQKGVTREDYASFHPGGTLGKKSTLKVKDIMRTGKSNPVVEESARVKDVLLIITGARAGAASVVNKKGRLSGIFTDGDLRRHLENGIDIKSSVKNVMTARPVTIDKEKTAGEALFLLKKWKIDEVPVVDGKGAPVGMLDIQDLIRGGIV